MTKQTVKTIALAFGFRAKWTPAYEEWTIYPIPYPTETYHTSDSDDAIYTILAMYRYYREHNRFAPSSEWLPVRAMFQE